MTIFYFFLCCCLSSAILGIGAETDTSSFLQFAYTGKAVNFTVPANVTFMTIDLVAARGGHCETWAGKVFGGKGGRIQAVLNVTEGMSFMIEVGGKPSIYDDRYCNRYNCLGGYGGGGGTSYYSNGAPGGGGSYLSILPAKTLIAAAGAGGGAFCDYSSACPLYSMGIYTTRGGDGGGLEGETVYDACVGRGGNQTSGGLGGDWLRPDYSWHKQQHKGSFRQGGGGFYGGGGGGGYYGGGLGLYAGGGGGSSFVTTASGYNAQLVVHTQGYRDDNGYVNIVFNKVEFLSPVDATESPTLAPSVTPTVRPLLIPTRRPTAGASTPSAVPSQAPSRRPTQVPVTSSPTYPIMVPVIAPTPVPSIPDDDYITCSRENLKFFSGEAHDECLNQLFSEVSNQVQTLTATVNYLAATLRHHINETSTVHSPMQQDAASLNKETIEDMINDKFNPLNTSVSVLTETFKDYLVETKYKQPTINPTPAPSRHRRSRRPVAAEPQA
jgi:hypothetical protein